MTATTSPARAVVTYTVEIGECVFVEHGHTTIPAGASVVLTETWLDTTAGAVHRFLRVQSTTATIDDVAVPDASTLWGPVRRLPEYDRYSTTWSYDAGVLASAGDALTVTFDVTLTRPLRDGEGNVYPEGSIFGGPIACTILPFHSFGDRIYTGKRAGTQTVTWRRSAVDLPSYPDLRCTEMREEVIPKARRIGQICTEVRIEGQALAPSGEPRGRD